MPFPPRSEHELQQVFCDYLRESSTHDEDLSWLVMSEPLERDTLAMMHMDLMRHLHAARKNKALLAEALHGVLHKVGVVNENGGTGPELLAAAMHFLEPEGTGGRVMATPEVNIITDQTCDRCRKPSEVLGSIEDEYMEFYVFICKKCLDEVAEAIEQALKNKHGR